MKKTVPPPFLQKLFEPFFNKGCTVVCLASGPSLCQEQIDVIAECKKKKDIIVIGCNDNWRWKCSGEFICDHFYAADDSFHSMYNQEIIQAGFDGPRWIPNKPDFAKKNGINSIPCGYEKGLSTQGRALFCGNHSGYQIIGMAYYLGASKIVLCGYDMKTGTGGRLHWFGKHPKGLRNTPNKYDVWIKNYKQLAADLDREGVDCVNCSIETAIPYFRRKDDLRKELLLGPSSNS